MSTFKEDKNFIKLWGKFASTKKGTKEHDVAWDKFMEVWRDIDRISIREYPEKSHALVMDMFLSIGELFDAKNIFEIEDASVLHEIADNLLDWGSAIWRYYELTPPYVKAGSKIPARIADLYAESRMCYVNGQFSSVIVLSRSIIEAVLKTKYFKKYLINLYIIKNGKKVYWNTREKLGELYDKRIITEQCYSTGWQIVDTANLILHRARVEKEKRAKNTIDHTKDFLEEIYSR